MNANYILTFQVWLFQLVPTCAILPGELNYPENNQTNSRTDIYASEVIPKDLC